MQLTDDQKQSIQLWAQKGHGLSEIQKLLREEYSLALTYMDVRLLVLDLGIELKDLTATRSMRPIELNKAEIPGAPDAMPAGEPAPGSLAVELDRVMKPGALVSGTVRFSDGVSASWSLDQMGRLGLNMPQKDYRPTPEDLQAFQQELSRLIQSRGM
ncbi:MAG: hypothetical protein GX806_03710 [Lentisphaerae bacterium]|nr:hypothetical protein [Lentisphaerota bacterium]